MAFYGGRDCCIPGPVGVWRLSPLSLPHMDNYYGQSFLVTVNSTLCLCSIKVLPCNCE